MRNKKTSIEKYLVPVLSHAMDLLEAFQGPRETLTLREITERTGIAHTTAFRILFTLVHRNYLTQQGRHYRLNQTHRRTRLGYCNLSDAIAFANTVKAGLQQAARDAMMDLLTLDNRLDPDAAVQNAQFLARERVDLVIGFQRHESVAPVIADIFSRAQIPAVSILIPQPGATYCGVDNYRAGMAAGAALARHAVLQWRGRFDLLILLDLPEGGPVLQSRMTGVLYGVENALGPLSKSRLRRVAGGGDREKSTSVVADLLKRVPSARRVLIAAASDEGGLGALAAVRSSRLAESSAIVGHGGFNEVWDAIAVAGSPYIGTVDFCPEQYGQALVDIAVRLLRAEAVSPYVYLRYRFLDRGDCCKRKQTDLAG